MRTLLILLLLSLPVSAEYFDFDAAFSVPGNAERGKQLAAAGDRFPTPCNFCHGVDGIALQDMHPNLAGQKDAYLRRQLVEFIYFKRDSHIMNRVLVDYDKQLPMYAPQDIADLAAHFSGIGCTMMCSAGKAP